MLTHAVKLRDAWAARVVAPNKNMLNLKKTTSNQTKPSTVIMAKYLLFFDANCLSDFMFIWVPESLVNMY